MPRLTGFVGALRVAGLIDAFESDGDRCVMRRSDWRDAEMIGVLKTGRGAAPVDRREVPPLREPTRSLRSEREEKASACFGRNDRIFSGVLV